MPNATSPLSEEQQLELRTARDRAGSFMGAAKVAAFNGWSLGIFAGFSILFGIFSATSLLVGIGLGVIARNEFVGRQKIKAFRVSGFELLWRNQIGLIAVISLYCLWSMYLTTRPDPEMAELTALLGEETGTFIKSITLAVYASFIGITVLVQGLNSRYYFLRVARLQEYVRETPRWVVELLA